MAGEKILDFKLNEEEQTLFNKSAEAVRSMNDVLKTFIAFCYSSHLKTVHTKSPVGRIQRGFFHNRVQPFVMVL